MNHDSFNKFYSNNLDISGYNLDVQVVLTHKCSCCIHLK